ncbi:FtsB family cell division protein [Parasphingorhabdus halotolerans]|uniref:Septum formation initiator family protein n=1 Tax=Parasphingorhabdus halotolerans TaxID=2725558 RepID=A0A6H2DIH5_9SPHN|nr:septum formation initiator family protein [Parasphingorhabdus halotolerans]QJB68190.1 septum formation initiator family protein [Parasphingorhabdus halotolerans]
MAQKEKIAGLVRSAIGPGSALLTLLLIAGYAVLGPTGILAWGDYQNTLESRQMQLAQLQVERDALRNRVNLLDPRGADPDLIGELLRKNVNVVHPDEIIVPLK